MNNTADNNLLINPTVRLHFAKGSCFGKGGGGEVNDIKKSVEKYLLLISYLN